MTFPENDLFCLENMQGVIVYPKKANALGSYDPSSVTTVKEEAWSYNAISTTIHHIHVVGTTVNVGINVVTIYDVRTGLPLFFPVGALGTFNLDPSPDNPPDASPATAKPRSEPLGPHGMLLPHGFGVRCFDPQARIQIYYSMEL